MSSVRWVSREEVVSALHKVDQHCRLVVGLDGPFQVWATSWGAHVVVPTIGSDKMCPDHDLTRVLRAMEQGRPK